MDAITGISSQDQSQGVVTSIENTSPHFNVDTTTPTQSTLSAATDFAAFMKQALGADKTEVNEEELFSALIEENLQQSNPEAATFFKSEKDRLSMAMKRPDGYVPVEAVAIEALKSTVASGKIDRTAAELINGKAFAGAQLDSNLDALYDSRGGNGDPTIAVAKMEEALLSMRAMQDKFDNGQAQPESRSLDLGPTPFGGANSVSTGSPIDAGSASPTDPANAPVGDQPAKDGSEGFLFKPVSDSNGKLVVLLPASLRGLVDRVELHSDLPPSDDNKLEQGEFASIGNGDRPHYRFSKPGGEYGDSLYVVAYRSDGETVTYQIDDPSTRTD